MLGGLKKGSPVRGTGSQGLEGDLWAAKGSGMGLWIKV